MTTQPSSNPLSVDALLAYVADVIDAAAEVTLIDMDVGTKRDARQSLVRRQLAGEIRRMASGKKPRVEPPCFAHKNDGIFYQCACSKCRAAVEPKALPTRVRLTMNVYDHGQDHHPPGYCGRKGDVVEVRSVESLAVAHEGCEGGFIVHRHEFEAVTTEPPKANCPECYGVGHLATFIDGARVQDTPCPRGCSSVTRENESSRERVAPCVRELSERGTTQPPSADAKDALFQAWNALHELRIDVHDAEKTAFEALERMK